MAEIGLVILALAPVILRLDTLAHTEVACDGRVSLGGGLARLAAHISGALGGREGTTLPPQAPARMDTPKTGLKCLRNKNR